MANTSRYSGKRERRVRGTSKQFNRFYARSALRPISEMCSDFGAVKTPASGTESTRDAPTAHLHNAIAKRDRMTIRED
jgi:hypothetical protein